jgi:GNAT superfamily N-acetyltransferase
MTEPTRMPIEIRDATSADASWIAEFLVSRWQSTMIGGHGTLIDATSLPALIAGDRAGLATYRLLGEDAELVSINALPPGRGTGTALIDALVMRLVAGCKRLWVMTTNDNLSALRFYQRRGFRLVKIWPGAVDAARKSLKPTIPQVGQDGIPIHDEIDLCRMLDESDDVVTLRPPWSTTA